MCVCVCVCESVRVGMGGFLTVGVCMCYIIFGCGPTFWITPGGETNTIAAYAQAGDRLGKGLRVQHEQVQRWFVSILMAQRTQDCAWSQLLKRLKYPVSQAASLQDAEASAETALRQDDFTAMAKLLHEWSTRGVGEGNNITFKRMGQRVAQEANELDAKMQTALEKFLSCPFALDNSEEVQELLTKERCMNKRVPGGDVAFELSTNVGFCRK
jgi:uncharacterized protein YecA (UPF0149 family)